MARSVLEAISCAHSEPQNKGVILLLGFPLHEYWLSRYLLINDVYR